ncbi:transmembrane protein KIAA1109 isoform X3 [Frankliniella occidentalis]|uniref:Transmembrane protein KIAA1109 isoform X3 n=1 Tax=Frankliniella occidentalis TaxID=133901 RepID=A0A9C6TZ84_FRAOC|nr:transmembrane protein KIAA1109 isoform X3 [Frankliniella occidentalis]
MDNILTMSPLLGSESGLSWPTTQPAMAAPWNYSSHVNLKDLKMDSNFAWLLCSLVSAMAWVIYITYYSSRVIGHLLTYLLNRFFIQEGHFKVGSFTWNVLSGKIMFRDVSYITYDYTLRVQDGYLIFRWWRSYVPKDVSEDLSHSDTRLSVMLNGFELHVYNRSHMYARLEKVFGLESQLFPGESPFKDDADASATTAQQQRPQPGAMLGKSWRDLIPVIKVDVSSGRVVFGNRLVPTTLSVNVEEAHFVYSTKPAASRLDHFMHFTKCKAENFKVILAPSPKYTGMVDDPPRYMGEGFVVLSSNNMDLYYYMDEPGVVPERPEMLRLANGDIVESAPPIWGMDIKCGKGTDFSYGPWADRQRENLFKFFFPNDYQSMKVTEPLKPGEKRQVQSFDIRLSTLNEATIDILFSKNKETNAVHINIGPGSYLEVTIPWIVQPDGYTTKVNGQLLHLEASTSLQYRSLVESETLEFGIKCHYPLKWNDHQEWILNLTGCKATVNLIFAHKGFFQDMINDWASKARPDLLHFIPYTWKLSLLLKEFELITLCNEYNWIDCSSQNQENSHIAFCGDLFDLSFDLPFVDFLPPTVPLRFWIQGESVDLTLYLPEVSSNRNVLLALDSNAKILGRDGNLRQKCEHVRRWRNVCQRSTGWVDCWSVPIVALSIHYTYHPAPPLGPPPQANITTPEKEEILLSPMRIPHGRKTSQMQWQQDSSQKLDPTTMPADIVLVELEIGPSVMLLYGSLLRNFMHLKENIFGEDQSFTDMMQSQSPAPSSPVPGATGNAPSASAGASTTSQPQIQIRKHADCREYRPMQVTVSVTMHDIQAHLVKNCGEKDPPCPIILVERFGFEMKKSFRETILQVLVSPSFLISSDHALRPGREGHLNQGHLMLSSLQVRHHAMFSDEGRSLDEDTLEYSWLVEVQLGKLSGKLTAPQLHHLITGLETFVMLICDSENNMRPPRTPKPCMHGLPPLLCSESDIETRYSCPTSDQVKYRMTRVAIDEIDIYLLEQSTAIELWASPIRVSTCNLHGNRIKSGVTALLPAVELHQFVASGSHLNGPAGSSTNTTGSGSARSQQASQHGNNGKGSGLEGCPELWLEVGAVSFGPLVVEAAIALPSLQHSLHLVQHKYLKVHDERTRRLWFLWGTENNANGKSPAKCGCIGGCAFFGSNRNGPRFFKPCRQDTTDGVNTASFRIFEGSKDYGYGQSILHEGSLVFHTPPYGSQDVTLYDPTFSCRGANPPTCFNGVPPKVVSLDPGESPTMVSTASPVSPSPVGDKRSMNRRFSYTSLANNRGQTPQLLRDVPYARLVDSGVSNLLPQKLDSDSKLHTERSKSILSVPEAELTPKCSVSDSKLAVDYFNSTRNLVYNQVQAAQSPLGPLPSDSNHSIEEVLQEVQRTFSMGSENPSELFYSADEDLSSLAGGASGSTAFSRNSSLQHSGSTLHKQEINGVQRRTYGSQQSMIVTSSTTPVIPDPVDTRSSLDLGVVAREEEKRRSPSPRIVNGHGVEAEGQHIESHLLDSSDSPSVSSTSFLSAVSSQDDLALVNLHMQVNKPIVDSPLLMSSYVNHLSQVSCVNWSHNSLPCGCDALTAPMLQRTHEGRLIYIGGRYVPHFEFLTEGFTSLKMVSRNNDSHGTPPPPSSKTPTHPYSWGDSPNMQSTKTSGESNTDCEEELLALHTEMGTRTTVIVKFKGDVDIMLSPLVLESLQRFIDALTPTFASLHPLTVLNHLHNECISSVCAANVLKHDQSLSYLSQLQASSKHSTAQREISAPPPTNSYEECIYTQTQGTIHFPKVNVTLLQASLVEEIISFAALDNLRDLTCVSLFAVCLDTVTVRFHVGKQTREVVQTLNRPVVLPANKKSTSGYKGLRPFLEGLQMQGRGVARNKIGAEPVYIETSDKQLEETIVALNVGKVHAQLRRFRNESSILKDAVITAIPEHCSRVLFTCARVVSPSRGLHSEPSPQEKENASGPVAEERLGFIMFECGLEGVSIKVVKRSQLDRKEGEIEDSEVEVAYTDSVRSRDDLDAAGEYNNPPRFSHADDTTSAKGTKLPGKQTLSSVPEGSTGSAASGPQPPYADVDAAASTATSSAGNAQLLPARSCNHANTSSCVIELHKVWFNFAAPPRTPITRKIDFTRLDWNLLSTASPAINAWMNPSNRLAIRVVHMFRSKYRRATAIVSSLMAEALDVQSIHMPVKSRYGRLTPMAKTLVEDPSCQLCNVLLKYVLQTDMASIEANLRESDLPHLSTLRQGVIVLSRQWKNVLYTPLLLEHNFKSKHIKPLNVTFAVPDLQDDENILTDGELSVTDECAMLIETAQHVHASNTLTSPTLTPRADDGDGATTQSSPHDARKKKGKKKGLAPSQAPSSCRASIVFPLLTSHVGHRKSDADKGVGYGALKEDQQRSPIAHMLGSNPSIYSGGAHGSNHSLASQEYHNSNLSPPAPPTNYEPNEDLYSWMTKQQVFMKGSEQTHQASDWESKINTMTTEETIEQPCDATAAAVAAGYSLYPIHDSLRLLDAHLIFEPLLSSLGVVPQQMVNNAGTANNESSAFESWGSNLTLVGSMDTMRIDIVVSEAGKPAEKKRNKSTANTKTTKSQGSKIFLDIPTDTPAFLCEKVAVELDLRKVADMTVDDLVQRQNVLYISRGQLKKHTSTTVNINLNIRYISQQVNMPLLRLLHQISNMYQNVKETQMELREQQPETTKRDSQPSTSGAPLASNHSGTIGAGRSHFVTDSAVAAPSYMGGQSSLFPRSHSQVKVTSPAGSIRSSVRSASMQSASVRSTLRHQSLAQKLRSTSKSVKGYMNLSEGVECLSPSGSALESIVAAKLIDPNNATPRCWKTVYYLLDLYATMPETKTIPHRLSVVGNPDGSARKYDRYDKFEGTDDVEKGSTVGDNMTASTPVIQDKPRELSVLTGERTRLIVFGVARIHRTRLLATLSGLKLEAEITSLHSSFSCRKKTRPASLECSLSGQVGRTMIVLLEGVAPNQQTVVKVTVGKSQMLYSSMTKRSKDKNSGLLTVGAVNIDIPQHPVALHGMMTRGSKQLSSTLQELRVSRATSRVSRGTAPEESEIQAPQQSPYPSEAQATPSGVHPPSARPQPESNLLQPLVMQFSVVLQSLSITAALLPSLQAQYKMDQVMSAGVTGSKAKFTIDLAQHSLSFTTKLQVAEANLPPEANIPLPHVHVAAEYITDNKNPNESNFADGVVLRQGAYLSAVADIGEFENTLTTDLLNTLVFVQKVFMKEVNEVVQKVYGGEKPVPIWLEGEETSSSAIDRILFSLAIRIKRIQLTATTPTSSAVRLETGMVEFQLSNRVQNVSGGQTAGKMFGKATVDINLSLGQLLRNTVFDEADIEFQQYAFFKTTIGLRNAFQDETTTSQGDIADKEVVLITLKRPLIYIQPMAVDKAILVWLNYKNAYEYWNEQRSNLTKEVLTATQQVFDKMALNQLTNQMTTPHLGTLFLQLTVEDMGICVPLNPLPLASWGLSRRKMFADTETGGAVVVTLENTSISACSSGSLVSKGRFVGLCLRFTDDFEISWDDWKPDMNDTNLMNLCVVSDGTYEVCSRTIAQKQGGENAKWILNVGWQMEGVDIHVDVNVGKQLSALGHTLTMLTGTEQDDDTATVESDSDETDHTDGQRASEIPSRAETLSVRKSRNMMDNLPAFVFDPSLDAKERSKLIEKEMNEQAKIISDLRSLGASHGTIEQEMKRLQELEAMVFKDFRRDMIQKLRRQSVKASSIKGKFGLGSKTSTYRSRSFVVPSPMAEQNEAESPEEKSVCGESPGSGPSRSASLRMRGMTAPKVTFSDSHTICRQSSLPSASSDLSLDWTPGSSHIDVDGERVELRRKPNTLATPSQSQDSIDGCAPLLEPNPRAEPGGASSPMSPYMTAMQKPQEPNIDFELDVKVLINSGKCVLHTKDASKDAKEDEVKLSSRMKKERSCSGGMLEFPPPSPNMSRRATKETKGGTSTTRLRYLNTGTPSSVAQLVDLTVFHIPGLDVKVHYESKTLNEENISPRSSTDHTYNPLGVPLPGGLGLPSAARRSSTKKASLFAWMTLQSIPEETIISPHILEFLEQTLEPIPSLLPKSTLSNPGSMNAMFSMDNPSDSAPLWGSGAGTGYVYSSFPVDVIVYFHMQPSTFRFSCLPVSRVECMLQLPSLDIVFSSKRAEEELQSEFGDGPSKMSSAPSAVGGLSVTGCLADFSVYIFHPYGGKKTAASKEAQWSPLADSERKDSLSINVEFVKVHLSRSRKLNFGVDPPKGGRDQSQACIRFSSIIDIGSASFKYDMRRLTEILAFPKAWYRRSIVRRLFLGDLSMGAAFSDGDDSPSGSFDGDTSYQVNNTTLGPKSRDKLRLNLDTSANQYSPFSDTKRWSLEGKSGTAWETLVLFAINFTKLNVHMNMGNVMGNVTWLTKDFKSEGRLSIGSTGHKNMFIGVGLGGSSLDAKGGIVGGTIELSKIDTYIHIREDPGTEPDHKVGLKLFALELRLDYMGTGVLMSRVSALDISLRDEWKISKKHSEDAANPTRRPAMIFMHGDMGWDQLQVMISKSTTADLLKMYYKLEEFFSQQFKSSKRVFSSFQPRARSSSFRKKQSGHTQPRQKKISTDSSGSSGPWSIQDARHHRHWQGALAHVAGLQLPTLRIPLPQSGSVLGGTMELHGRHISLACFHGINFKSKSWALFSLKEPCISFATEAQEVPSGETVDHLDVHVVQTLTCSLGMTAEQAAHAQHHSMATVCRMSRNILFPPQFKTLQEWFHYAFVNSEMDAVDQFPSLERERTESTNTDPSRGTRPTTKPQDLNHTREVIFALPSLQLHIKTEHLQAARTPDNIDRKPVVECSFITEFEDHIFVTVDAEAFFFLHDLITSYVKEKERVVIQAQSGYRASSPDPEKRPKDSQMSPSGNTNSNGNNSTSSSDTEPKRKGFDPADVFTKDWRNYHCTTWHLEPTVRLLSWAGKSIEPYGVDYILQKLGFSHARTTIPKWVQRGFMDPLDKVLAVLLLRMVTAVSPNQLHLLPSRELRADRNERAERERKQ